METLLRVLSDDECGRIYEEFLKILHSHRRANRFSKRTRLFTKRRGRDR